MSPDQVAMLVCGIVLFVVALGLLVYCIATRRAFKAVLFVFLLAIIMIGFRGIRPLEVKAPGVDLRLEQMLAAVEQNPNDPAARTRLADAVAEVRKQPKITPKTLMTLAKAQRVLGARRSSCQPKVSAKDATQPEGGSKITSASRTNPTLTFFSSVPADLHNTDTFKERQSELASWLSGAGPTE